MMEVESKNSYMKSFTSTSDAEWVAQTLQEVKHSVDCMLKIIQEDDESDSDEAYANHQKRSQLTSLINGINQKHQMLGKKFEELTVSTSRSQNQLESYENEMGLLKANLDSEKNWAVELQEKIEDYTTDTTDSELETSKLIASLQNALRNSETEKGQLMSGNAVLSEKVVHLEAKYAEKEVKIKSLENEIKKHEALNDEMKESFQAKEMQWHNKEEFLKTEVNEKSRNVEALNKIHDGLKLKFDMLMAEKDGLNAKLQTLDAEIRSKDIMIQQAECLKVEVSRTVEALDTLMAEKNGLNMKLQTLDAELQSKDIMIQQAECLKAEASRNVEAFDMLMAEKNGLNVKLQALDAELRFKDMMIQQAENSKVELEALNKTHDGLKLKFDTLMAEKDGLNAKLQTLNAEMCSKDNTISDRCEEKREAIRQLCISLEHYRNGYQELRKAYIGQQRRQRRRALTSLVALL